MSDYSIILRDKSLDYISFKFMFPLPPLTAISEWGISILGNLIFEVTEPDLYDEIRASNF